MAENTNAPTGFLVQHKTVLTVDLEGFEPAPAIHYSRFTHLLPRRAVVMISQGTDKDWSVRAKVSGPGLKKDGTPGLTSVEIDPFLDMDDEGHIEIRQERHPMHTLAPEDIDALVELIQQIDEVVHPVVLLAIGTARTHLRG